MIYVSVYINKERRIVVSQHEIPFHMSEPWPVIKLWCHRTRGLINLSDCAKAYEFGIAEDCEEITLARYIIAMPDESSAGYAASWAFAHMNELA